MESFLGLDLTRNYSFFTVPAAFFIAALPHAYTIIASRGTYDNANPRSHKDNIEKCENFTKSASFGAFTLTAATENGFETLGLYAAGIVAANFAGVPTPTINALSFSYVASRVAYNVAYLWLQADRRLAPVRSLVWTTSIGFIVTLWIKAGNKMLSV
ncbi:membrane protein [Fusarium sporotrichioides]|uniref:Membrane protein n=1 Tax=Fusarium sporotrichioides TaxID=5514 RepID=A0A395RTZ4_FUSSP|nr:membrane protein [Fusarium sporotrichioides]